MSITKGLGEGDTNSKSSLFCHASAAEQEGGGWTLLSCSPTQRQLPGRSWKAPAPRRGAQGTGEACATAARSRKAWGSDRTLGGQERHGIRWAHQLPEGGMD